MFGLEIAGLVGSIIGTATSIYFQNKQFKKQEEAQDLQLQQQQERTKMAQIQAFEKARIASATSQSNQASQGAYAPDASAIGGAYSIRSQGNNNVRNLSVAQGYANKITDIFQDAAQYGQYASWAQGVAAVSGSVASNAGTLSRTPDLFGSEPAAPAPSSNGMLGHI